MLRSRKSLPWAAVFSFEPIRDHLLFYFHVGHWQAPGEFPACSPSGGCPACHVGLPSQTFFSQLQSIFLSCIPQMSSYSNTYKLVSILDNYLVPDELSSYSLTIPWWHLQFCNIFSVCSSFGFSSRSISFLFWFQWLARCWSPMCGSWLGKVLQCWPRLPSSWECGRQPSQRWPLFFPPYVWARSNHHHCQRGCTRRWGWVPSSWEVTGMAITCCCGKCPIRSWPLWLLLTGSKNFRICWIPWRLRPCIQLCKLLRTKGLSSSRSYREQWASSSTSIPWAFHLRPHFLLHFYHPLSRPSVISRCRALCILSLQGSFSIRRVSLVPVGTPIRVDQRVSSHLASKIRSSVAQSSFYCSLGFFLSFHIYIHYLFHVHQQFRIRF